MDTAKSCQDKAAEYLRLMQSAQNETEARLLRSISQSWMRLANQLDRYQSFVLSEARATRSVVGHTRNCTIHSEPGNARGDNIDDPGVRHLK